MRRTIHIHPDGVRDLYLIPRGVAGELTKLIRALETDPTPTDSRPAPGRPGRHEFRALGHVIVYEVSEDRITILVIQED